MFGIVQQIGRQCCTPGKLLCIGAFGGYDGFDNVIFGNQS